MRKWRVGTVSMGLMLVATGVLLLLSELQGINGAGLILRWWPAILIILGMEILAYVIFSKEEQTKIRFDGLSIFLTIFIILVSSGVYAASTFVNSSLSTGFFGNIGYFQHETIDNKSYEIDAAKVNKIQINNIKGKVNVTKYDGKKIMVDTSIVIRNNDEEAAKKLISDLVEIIQGETLAITTKNSSLFDGNRNYQIDVNYSIRVPKELNYEVTNSFGEITLDNLIGNVKVTGKYGQVTAKGIQGDLNVENSFGETRIKDVTGKVQVENEHGAVVYSNSAPCKDLNLKSKMGSVSVELPKTQQGMFKALTKFGELSFDGFGAKLEIKNENTKQQLEGIIGSSSPLISVEAEHGAIDIQGR